MSETLEDVRAAILAAQAEQEKANAAAARAAAAAARANEAERIAEAARQARELAWAEQQIASYDADVAAGLDAVREARDAFYRAAIDDLPAAMRLYVEWRAARERLWLRWRDQQNALAIIARAGGKTVDQHVVNPLPSFVPDFDAALNEAVKVKVREVTQQIQLEHDATVRTVRGMEAA